MIFSAIVYHTFFAFTIPVSTCYNKSSNNSGKGNEAMANIVVLNGQRVNYDGQVDYSVLGADVAVYDHSAPEV